MPDEAPNPNRLVIFTDFPNLLFLFLLIIHSSRPFPPQFAQTVSRHCISSTLPRHCIVYTLSYHPPRPQFPSGRRVMIGRILARGR